MDPGFVLSHPDFQGLLTALQLNEQDLSTAAYLRRWFMDILKHENVAYVDPLGEMKAAADSAAVFRIEDLHPSLQGNLAIAAAIAKQSHFFNLTDESQRRPKTTRTNVPEDTVRKLVGPQH